MKCREASYFNFQVIEVHIAWRDDWLSTVCKNYEFVGEDEVKESRMIK